MDDYDDETPVAPHDRESERAALGAMLLDARCIPEVAAISPPTDFYLSHHIEIAEVLVAMNAAGRPTDPIAVHDEFMRRGRQERIGGAAYLHQLMRSAPAVVSATYHAGIVARHAQRRHLMAVGTRLMQMGADPATDLDDIPDLYAVAMKDLNSALDGTPALRVPSVGDLFPATLDGIERPVAAAHVPTGIHDLDSLFGGWSPGQLIIVGARPSIGKALALDTPIATPTGWTTMGAIEVGDFVFGADGVPTEVVAATETMLDRPCYEVHFSDGSVIVADADHQWLTETRSARRAKTPPRGYTFHRDSPFSHDQRWKSAVPSVVTTKEIAETLRCGSDQRFNHSVANAKPLVLPDAELPIPPYTLGAWLGDGTSRCAQITGADAEIFDNIRADGFIVTKLAAKYQYSIRASPRRRVRKDNLQVKLRENGLLGNKHVPEEYLRASERQRRDLLAGLLDTDGFINPNGTVQLAVTSRRIAEGAYELIIGLGYRASLTTKQVAGRTPASSTAYMITFTPSDEVFRITRKQARRAKGQKRMKSLQRYVTDVREIPSVPVRCIEVANDSHMYLAGRTMIPTHNSTLGVGAARHAAIRCDVPTLIWTGEMSSDDMVRRMISAEAKVNLHHIVNNACTDDDWDRIAAIAPSLAKAPLFIDETPSIGLGQLRHTVSTLKRTAGLGLLVVDYIQLMSAPKAENREQRVAELSRSLKQLAKEFAIPVIALAQLNRGPEQRPDKTPQMSDLRESGSLEADADTVILMHREDFYQRESPRAGECDLIVAKSRGSQTATVTVAFQGHYARCVDMARDSAPWTPHSAMPHAA